MAEARKPQALMCTAVTLFAAMTEMAFTQPQPIRL